MSQISVQVSQGGRIVIPAEIRLKMGVNIGDQVLLSWSDEVQELRIATRKQRLQNALSLVKQYAMPSDSVVDLFINERRQAAADE
ncbi:MAG: AbrB/MazE/SpoVT family DNA-binding domain-containing protein [Gallionella sp.]|nr:AbrB/MazE/SpoVT family DNA-binding domain-containing protein [Gallionella sp.]